MNFVNKKRKWGIRIILIGCMFSAGCLPVTTAINILQIVENNKIKERLKQLEHLINERNLTQERT